MKLKIKVDNATTNSELRLLGAFFTGLADQYEPCVLAAPADTAELPVTAIDPLAQGDTHVEAPKRRRRTKAEIAAMDAVGEVVAVEPEPEQVAREAALNAEAEAQAAYDQARNQPDPEPVTDTEPAAASPSKTYTEAEVQDLAGKVARAAGPEVVKAKIAELGAARIADLTQEQRDSLGNFLATKLP